MTPDPAQEFAERVVNQFMPLSPKEFTDWLTNQVLPVTPNIRQRKELSYLIANELREGGWVRLPAMIGRLEAALSSFADKEMARVTSPESEADRQIARADA